MFSYMLTKVKDRFVSLLTDVCPCFDPQGKKTLSMRELHHQSRRLHSCLVDIELGDYQGKILTVERMKKLARRKMNNEDDESQKCFKLEPCPWNSESSDMLLKVGRSVFPVHRFLLSIESEILKTIIESVPATKNETTVVTLNGYEADEIQMLLMFVYLPDAEMNGKQLQLY